jgi:hypothetical protein
MPNMLHRRRKVQLNMGAILGKISTLSREEPMIMLWINQDMRNQISAQRMLMMKTHHRRVIHTTGILKQDINDELI